MAMQRCRRLARRVADQAAEGVSSKAGAYSLAADQANERGPLSGDA